MDGASIGDGAVQQTIQTKQEKTLRRARIWKSIRKMDRDGGLQIPFL